MRVNTSGMTDKTDWNNRYRFRVFYLLSTPMSVMALKILNELDSAYRIVKSINTAKQEAEMSWQQIEGNWRQFVGEAKKHWSKLTDDDLLECEGNRDKLVGKLQELYDMTPDQANKEIAHIEQRLGEAREGAERMYGAAKR